MKNIKQRIHFSSTTATAYTLADEEVNVKESDEELKLRIKNSSINEDSVNEGDSSNNDENATEVEEESNLLENMSASDIAIF